MRDTEDRELAQAGKPPSNTDRLIVRMRREHENATDGALRL